MHSQGPEGRGSGRPDPLRIWGHGCGKWGCETGGLDDGEFTGYWLDG